MSAPDKLTITLSQLEKDNIGSWVAKYRAHPELIGTTKDSGLPDWQTRIVLDAQTRARFDEIASQFPVDAPVQPPAPPSAGPLARFDAAPSNWAAWNFITDAEKTALKAKYPEAAQNITLLAQFYEGGGGGGIKVTGFAYPGNSYQFWKLVNGEQLLTPDVGGAADVYMNELCDSQARPHPPVIR